MKKKIKVDPPNTRIKFQYIVDLSREDKIIIIKKVKKEEVLEKEEVKTVEEKSEHVCQKGKLQLHYDIQIHLPETRDEAVYDAIFSSLKKHLF